mmetsp:Transcript_4294/g.12003  ORF Transcript_4294/g.12003 Transcript_4294/m.12003 type:complete len:81 (+) Transcript_4294:372-614(+)
MAMREPMRIASSKSWVMNKVVFFITLDKARNSSCKPRLMSGSSAENGSSIKRISGSAASALARPTRCCIPPDNCDGYLSP